VATQTAQTITAGQVKELGSALIEGIPTELPKERAQSLIGDKERLQELLGFALTVPDGFDIDELRQMVASFLPFGDEEYTDSDFVYKVGFPRLTWAQRLDILQKIFGGLKTEGTLGMPKFIELLRQRGVDEWVDDINNPFIIPDWQAVAPTYAEATVIAWTKLAESKTYKGRTYNYREGVITPDLLRLVDDELYRQLESEWGCKLHGIPTATAHERLRELRPFPEMNVWPVFAQTGLRHRGKSVRRGHVMYSETEWGLGPFEIACILLTDGEDRLTAYENLAIDAPGAFYRPRPDEPFGKALCFSFSGDRLRLGGNGVSGPDRRFGSGSASLR